MHVCYSDFVLFIHIPRTYQGLGQKSPTEDKMAAFLRSVVVHVDRFLLEEAAEHWPHLRLSIRLLRLWLHLLRRWLHDGPLWCQLLCLRLASHRGDLGLRFLLRGCPSGRRFRKLCAKLLPGEIRAEPFGSAQEVLQRGLGLVRHSCSCLF
uniref:Uncharacterized protein n=1 Tax=Arundo donax TaxID=35708 RepID=A0A0A9FHQ0_ARUDO